MLSLEDWIEKDDSINCTISEIDSYLSKNKYLKLCADFCNSSKHLILNSSGWNQKNPKIGQPILNVRIGIDSHEGKQTTPLFTGLRYAIEMKDNEYIEALDLASECLNAWTHFLLPYIGNRVTNIVEKFQNQTIDGSFFSSDVPVKLPCVKDIKQQKNRNFGIVMQASAKGDNFITITRLKSFYAHAEDREKTRGGILHGKFEQQNFSNLNQLIQSIPSESFIWLILAMEKEEKILELAKSLKIYISNSEQLAKIESVLNENAPNKACT